MATEITSITRAWARYLVDPLVSSEGTSASAGCTIVRAGIGTFRADLDFVLESGTENIAVLLGAGGRNAVPIVATWSTLNLSPALDGSTIIVNFFDASGALIDPGEFSFLLQQGAAESVEQAVV